MIPIKILIAVPTFENIFPDTFKSIYDLENGGHELIFDYVRGYDVATARNNIAQKAIDMGVDYVLMVDNDVILPSNTLLYFLEDPKEVCLGYYAHRSGNNKYDGKMCLGKLGQVNYPVEALYSAKEIKELSDKGTFKTIIHGGGFGCAFIKATVFHKLRFPWFDWVNYPSKGILSEDLYFCEQCHREGILVWMDTRVGCAHIMRQKQWPE